MDNLETKYKFSNKYFESISILKKDIINKSVIPHQVEFQPGPISKKICWLSCPYCYGSSATDTGERMSKDRFIEIINEIANGGVKKITFAGWATDPLNYKYIDELLEASINNNLTFGFNTKPLKISDKFISLLSRSDIKNDSWISLSVDAGCNETFNKVHGVKNLKLPLYDQFLSNVKSMSACNKNKRKFDLSAAYLVNKFNCNKSEIIKFINDFRDAGCNIIRFSFAQPPRGKIEDNMDTVPSLVERNQYLKELENIVKIENTNHCKIIIIDPDQEHDIYYKARTTPCVARFIYPTVGFDGRLYQCSQSAAPNFKKTEIGDLKNNNFWDLYYNYDVKDFYNYFEKMNNLFNEVECRCDRKEHIANNIIKSSGEFER